MYICLFLFIGVLYLLAFLEKKFGIISPLIEQLKPIYEPVIESLLTAIEEGLLKLKIFLSKKFHAGFRKD